MWFSFWRTRSRLSLEELRYLTDQLQKVQVVNEVNKDFVIEALRSISELVTYGDQHDPSFFECFMEKQIMGEFIRILNISRVSKVALQVLQTMSIIIQNLRREHSIYYILSNENMNNLIMYSFDFQNEEILSYYISFLRAVSGKLNKDTVLLLVKTENDVVISFPLYVEAIKFAFHNESMIRVAIRALTLNVYHVGDDSVNKYVSSAPHSQYFTDIVAFFQKQCIKFNKLAIQSISRPDSSESMSTILSATEEIEDKLYYFSDVMSSGVPDIGKLITDNMLRLLIFGLLLPALGNLGKDAAEMMTFTTSLYLLGSILHIVKNKDTASTVAATLFHPPELFAIKYHIIPNEQSSSHKSVVGNGEEAPGVSYNFTDADSTLCKTLREVLLSNMTDGENSRALGSLCFFAILLRTKELDESTLDGLGILPQRKKHKKLLLQALVGEDLAEEQLFAIENGRSKSNICNDLDVYLKNLEDQYGITFRNREWQVNFNMHRSQVLDALVSLICRSDVSPDTRWFGGWFYRQLLPHEVEELTNVHLKLLTDSHRNITLHIFAELGGCWCDSLVPAIKHAWRSCKRTLEAPSPPKDLKSIILPPPHCNSEGGTSVASGQRMFETIKVYVLLRQVLVLSRGGALSDQLPVGSDESKSESSTLKTGHEMDIANAIPCRIAFERGVERHFSFLAFSLCSSGWLLLLEPLPLREHSGIVRVVAPLAGADPRVDGEHPTWLHLRIRPSTLPFLDAEKPDGFSRRVGKLRALIDGRWTLAFIDEKECARAEAMVIREMDAQRREVEAQVKRLLEFETDRP